MLALQLCPRFLQQFADVQNIGQTALTARGCEHVLRNVTLCHELAHHRHHAALLPFFAVANKLFYHGIPRGFVIVEHINITRIQPEHRTRQCTAQRTLTLWRQHGLQQPKHLLGFQRFKNAVAVGKIDGRNIQ